MTQRFRMIEAGVRIAPDCFEVYHFAVPAYQVEETRRGNVDLRKVLPIIEANVRRCLAIEYVRVDSHIHVTPLAPPDEHEP